MRTLLVVALAEAIKATLLGAQIRRRRTGRLFLQRQMETFMAAVLLRLPGLDPFGKYSGLDQANRQLRQASRTRARKRWPIVAAYPQRQSELPERRIKYGPNPLCARLFHALTAKQITAISVL